MLTSTQQAVLWIGCAGMGVGALAIAGLGLRAPRGQKYHFIMSAAVCAIAFTLYYTMANGLGISHVGHRLEFWARYVDWTFTTPLLIGGLLLIGYKPRTAVDGEDARERNGVIIGALGADVFMILTGLAAGLTHDNAVKYGFYAISCIAFLVVLAALWGPTRRAAHAQGTGVGGMYDSLTRILSGLWIVYPVLWILGTEGVGAFSLTLEIVLFAAIDLTAKVAFGLLLTSRILQEHGSTAAAERRTPQVAAARA